MRGVKTEDMVAIVDFLYYGEANVYQENIDAFLAIAEEPDLKGLTGNRNNDKFEEPIQTSPRIKKPASKSGVSKMRQFEEGNDHNEAIKVERHI